MTNPAKLFVKTIILCDPAEKLRVISSQRKGRAVLYWMIDDLKIKYPSDYFLDHQQM